MVRFLLAEEQCCGKKRVSELQSRLDITHTELVQISEQCEGLQVKNKQLLQILNDEKVIDNKTNNNI